MLTFTLGPLQEQWLQELESGRHNQGKGYLYQKNGETTKYCCLGVAAMFVLKLEPFGTACMSIFSFDGSEENLLAYEHIGLHDSAGKLLERFTLRDIEVASLAEMNDKGMTFQDIAAYIRANPENVFVRSV